MDKEVMKVYLTAHMHFKEGHSFSVASPGHDQNGISFQDAFRINVQTEKADTKQFSMCSEQTGVRLFR